MLWSHQSQALKDIAQAIEDGHENICLTSPTGGGKSRIIFEMLKWADYKSVLHTDRRMLRKQLTDNMNAAGIEHGVIASGVEPSLARVQLAMTQTLVARCVNKGRMVHPADLIIWDEVHKQSKGKSLELRSKYNKAIDIGVTATPLGVGGVYDKLIVAGTNSQLRDQGRLVPARHYAPDEPSTALIGKVVPAGECGILQSTRKRYVHRIAGSVVENYLRLNPKRVPSLLFAPGIAESVWLCDQLNMNGITAAHIDGKSVYLDGERIERKGTDDDDVIEEVRSRLESGKLNVVCNRFVLREGIDWPFIGHLIFATVFGSMMSYLQAGGRGLRASTGKYECVVQCHGGNAIRHGSLNSDRDWNLLYTDRIMQNVRAENIRQGKQAEPYSCIKCGGMRTSGMTCPYPNCGHIQPYRARRVMQADGSLREVTSAAFKRRKYLPVNDEKLKRQWVARVKSTRNSKKEKNRNRTYAQVASSFAHEHPDKNGRPMWPRPNWPEMPDKDWKMYFPVTFEVN